MKILRYCRMAASVFACLVFVVLLSVSPISAQDTEDSRLFLTGFNAYQQKDYATAVSSLNDVLQKYPDTPLRDMTLFWLARANFKAGNQQEAARFMSQFNREFPDNPLRQTAEEELQALASRYDGQPRQAVAAARQAEQERLKREQEERARLIAARAAEERAVREKAAAEQRAETERLAREKAAADKLAQEKAAQETAEKAEKARLLKAEEERLARERSEREAAEQLAKEKAASDKLAQEKAARETADKTEKTRLLKAEEERRAREQREREAAERLAREKAAKERLAQEKAAKEAAESERRARERAERIAKATAEAEKRAAEKRAEQQASAQKAAAAQDRQNLREKAIAEYKAILERYPDSPAARTAIKRLKSLGVTVAQPQPRPAAKQAPTAAPATQVLTLEVAQYAAFEFNPAQPQQSVEVARPTELRFEIVNRGNGRDSFYLASGFPKEFGVRFAADNAPEQSINQTPPLAPGESFKGRMTLTVPSTTIDGLRMTYPVQAASQYMPEASQSREIALTASAPLLRAVVKGDKAELMPGERTQYRITVLNVGSAVARDVTLRINQPPQLDPLEPVSGGLRQEMKAALVLDGIQLRPGERRDVTVSYQVRDDALAREELMVRADLINTPLQTRSSFLSTVAHVQPRSDVSVQLAHTRITTIPGQVVLVPVTVVNRGNLRESFSVVADVPSSQKVTIYHDLNRDGTRQADEPEITTIGPLGPREEAALLLEITTPRTAQDGSEAGISLSVAPQSGTGKPVLAAGRMVFSRPVVLLAMKGRDGRLTPGELLTVELAVVNQGSNLARLVEVTTSWPEQMELVATETASDSIPGGRTWRFTELGAGEKRIIKASFRVKPGTVVGTGLQLKSALSYLDQLGNRY